MEELIYGPVASFDTEPPPPPPDAGSSPPPSPEPPRDPEPPEDMGPQEPVWDDPIFDDVTIENMFRITNTVVVFLFCRVCCVFEFFFLQNNREKFV